MTLAWLTVTLLVGLTDPALGRAGISLPPEDRQKPTVVTIEVPPPGVTQELRLRDGSLLYGRVDRIEGDRIVFRTATGGQIEVDRAQVAARASDRPVGAAAPPMAEAQGVASSFDQLRLLVRPGDTVSVTDTAGREITGKIADLSASSLVLLVAGSRRDLPEGEVRTIRQRRGDSLANGALWGLGIGAGLGLVAGVAVGAIGDVPASGWVIPVLAVIYGGIGSGIGAGVDAMIQGQLVIYDRPPRPLAKLSVSPLLTRERKGVLVLLRF